MIASLINFFTLQTDLNECELGFHDCHEKAVCVDRQDKYDCNCMPGWQALGVTDANKWANGRECWGNKPDVLPFGTLLNIE